jgi:hypothetical protein
VMVGPSFAGLSAGRGPGCKTITMYLTFLGLLEQPFGPDARPAVPLPEPQSPNIHAGVAKTLSRSAVDCRTE